MRFTVACWLIEAGLQMVPKSYQPGFWRVVRVRTHDLGWDKGEARDSDDVVDHIVEVGSPEAA